ncbi:MAG: hypothetical protein ACF788_09565, partial [Novipirellula sp. JB048]
MKSLDLSGESLVRQIRLHRGLNILWAKPPEANDRSNDPNIPNGRKAAENQLHEAGVAGHSAGKTTFTRFIRYVLGEPTFGDEQLTADIRESFPDGWVTAQIHVDNQSWLVARPFVGETAPFAVRSDDWKDLVCESGRMSLDEFIAAIESAAFARLPRLTFPSSGDQAKWSHLLPWLSRDQDCHFGNLTKWRCPESQSQSSPLKASDRQYLVQTFLGLLSKKELTIARANVKRRKQIAKLRERLRQLAHQEQVDANRLTELFGDSLPPFADGLFDDAVVQE